MALYNASGNFRVTVGDTTRTGIYAADGSLRVTVVSGSTYTGLFAADGSYNVVIVNSTDAPVSVYHSCGAFRATSPSSSSFGVIAPNGAFYMDGLVPQSLFANNEVGGWWDPSDFSSMFQDSAGTTPVTGVEQPVGLHLDKSKGLVLGADLAVNGALTSGTSWLAEPGWSLTNNRAEATAAGSAYVYQTASLGAYSYFEVTFTVSNRSAGGVRAYVGNAASYGPTVSADGTYTHRIFCAGSFIDFGIQSQGGFTGYIDNISIKKIAGNHRYQSTSAARPTLSARYNLFTKTEQYDDAAWTKDRISVSTHTATAPDGTATAAKIIDASMTANSSRIYHSITLTAIGYTMTVYAKAAELSWCYIRMGDSKRAWFDLGSGVVGSADAGLTSSISASENGYYKLTCSIATATAGAGFGLIGLCTGNSVESYTTSGGNGIYVWHPDFRVTNDGVGLPAYQRVNTSTDYDTSGFPMYLKYDGVDDFMQTASVDFSATDAVSLYVGCREAAPSGNGMLIEFSTSTTVNTSSFYLYMFTDSKSYFGSYGTLAAFQQVASAALSVPTTQVITGLADISSDYVEQRINGVSVGTNSNDQGSGNFGNYALYFGGRAGTSLFFNGREYQTIIRGAASSAAEIAAAEAFVNLKTKAY